jgi:hypothetical protein
VLDLNRANLSEAINALIEQAEPFVLAGLRGDWRKAFATRLEQK